MRSRKNLFKRERKKGTKNEVPAKKVSTDVGEYKASKVQMRRGTGRVPCILKAQCLGNGALKVHVV